MKFGKMIAALVLSSVCMAGCSSELTDELSRQAAGFAESAADFVSDSTGVNVKDAVGSVVNDENIEKFTKMSDDLANVTADYIGMADKYVNAGNKLSECIPAETAGSNGESVDDIWEKLNEYGDAIKDEAMSDSQKTEMDGLIATIDNLYAQSKNVCDTKLNDIIALSQGSYTGEFENKMKDERKEYDDLINAGKYAEAYQQLLDMEKMYNEEVGK